MSSRDSRKPPESTPHAVDLRSDPLGLARAQARSPGDPEPQVWALYPLLRPQAEAAAEPPPPDLLRLLPEVARRGRRAIAIGLLAGLAFAAAYLFVAAPIYIVKAVVQVEYRRSVIRDVEARPGSTYVGTQSEVMQSPALIEAAIRAIGLPEPEPPGIIDRVRDWVEALNPFRSDEVVDPIARAVLATLPALQASPVLGTDVLTLTLRTDAPQRGVRLLDALVSSYRSYVRENETAVHREGLDLLRGREAALAAQIAEVGTSYRERESAIRSLGTGADALMVHRLELEEHAKARVGAVGRRIDLENELAALREQSDASVAPTAQIEEDLARSEDRK